MNHLLSISELTRREILKLIRLAVKVKKRPKKFFDVLKNKTLLMIFEAPSLRTRVSFEVAMNQLGGSALNYSILGSPLGSGKETIEDTSKTISRYCDTVAARIYDHKTLVKFAGNSSIPVINAMTNFSHPCQILSDFLTIYEKRKLKNIKIAYLGDSNNNVTHSLLFASSILGTDISIACPKQYQPMPEVLKQARKFAKVSNSNIEVVSKPESALKEASVVYTDSWMSYRIPKSQKTKRVKIFKQYQVNKKSMSLARENALFMHCLPALRGYEVTKDVIDGSQSVIWEQASNRLHIQKAILLTLLK